MREIKRIIIHCSASPSGRADTIEDIDRWHRARGWNGCGYHYVIHLDGTVHPGRPESEIGAHCTGYNSTSIGICYIGGMNEDLRTPADTRTEAQKQALLTLLRELRTRYPKARILGHRDLAHKACPSFDARKEYEGL